jgi:hypothetical protein
MRVWIDRDAIQNVPSFGPVRHARIDGDHRLSRTASCLRDARGREAVRAISPDAGEMREGMTAEKLIPNLPERLRKRT